MSYMYVNACVRIYSSIHNKPCHLFPECVHMYILHKTLYQQTLSRSYNVTYSSLCHILENIQKHCSYVCDWVWENWYYCPCQQLSPLPQSYMNKLSNFITKISLSGLLLLVAFTKYSGDAYEQSGALMELWSGDRLYVAVQCRGVE